MSKIFSNDVNLETEFPQVYKLLKDNGYDKLNFDAQLKWCAIIDLLRIHVGSVNRLLDVGGGYSATTFLMSKCCCVTNVDINYGQNWFCSDKGIIPGLKDYDMDNIEFKEINFLTQSDQLFDDFYDVVVDGCSLIHFKPEYGYNTQNIGLSESCKIIYKKLKPGGYFVVSSDLNNGKNPPTSEWLSPQDFINIIKSAGFEIIGPDSVEMPENPFDVKDLGFLTVGAFIFQKPQS